MSKWKVDLADISLDEQIGKGNFGEVYKGTWKGKTVAVKKLYFVDDDFMAKYIEREMDLLTGIQHENIVALLALCIEVNDIYIITEYVGGGDLRKRLKDKAIQMDWSQRISIALQTALAMEYLHDKGLIHRDLKSHNLLVDDSEDPEDWTVKVCDFGLARKEDGGDFKTIVGTNKWMAPEVSMGETYGKSADVFSFGMVLLELITREKPPERKLIKGYAFEEEEVQSLIPKDTPPALWDILKKCTSFESEKRPTFSALADMLLDLMEEMEGGDDKKKKKKKKKDRKEKKDKKKK